MRSPCARSSASTIRVVVDLPFVPTTWTAGRPGLRLAELARSARIRSEPEPVLRPRARAARARRRRDARRTCRQVPSSSSSRAVAVELAALGLDDLGGRVRDEPLVREHPLRARDLLARGARPLGLDVAVVPAALRPDDRGEDAPLVVARELDLDAAAAEDLRRLLDAVERAAASACAVVAARATARRSAARRGPGAASRSPPSRAASSGWRSASSRSSARERGRARVLVAVVEPPLDRLGVPVAEVVEREVVEDARSRRRSRTGPRPSSTSARAASSRARIQRSSSAAGRSAGVTPSVFWRIEPRDVPELGRELAPLLDRPRRVADVLRRRDLEEPVAGRVGAVRLDRLHRVDPRAEALRHPPPVGARAPSSG